MSLYIVKHDDGHFRFHRDNGQEIGSAVWDEKPSQMELVESLADEHKGASILGNASARWDYTEIVTNQISYRDLTLDEESVPWEDQP